MGDVGLVAIRKFVQYQFYLPRLLMPSSLPPTRPSLQWLTRRPSLESQLVTLHMTLAFG